MSGTAQFFVNPFSVILGVDRELLTQKTPASVHERLRRAQAEYDRALGRDPRPSPALRALAKKYGTKPNQRSS